MAKKRTHKKPVNPTIKATKIPRTMSKKRRTVIIGG